MRSAALALALLLGGCAARGPILAVDVAQPSPPPDVYTKAEIDAMQAQTTCRAQARTMLQLSRCEPAGRIR